MAEQNKEHLRKLLDFINNEIIHKPENSWFVEELRKQISTVAKTTETNESAKISKIEQYLALDFGIDTEHSLCDYSFLDDFLQIKAESDFREMKRFKLGLRGHKKDFSEFCRYIVLQAELLLNFFYSKYYEDRGGIDSVISVIKQFNTAQNGTQYYKPKTDGIACVEDIPFNYKLWAFGNQYGADVRLIDMARQVRNALSHRSSSADKPTLAELHRKLASLGITTREDGSLPFLDKRLLYLQEVKDYKFELFLYRQQFDSLEKSLKVLADTVYELVKT